MVDWFSRRAVGWCIADAENAALFQILFDDTIARHDEPPGQFTLHADRGGPMKAKAITLPLADLGVTKSSSRPHVSNDNPFPESPVKTLKYQQRFPKCFDCMEDTKRFHRECFAWHNEAYHHAGLGLMTPNQVHDGQIDAIHAAIPSSSSQNRPYRPQKPNAVRINPPQNKGLPKSLN